MNDTAIVGVALSIILALIGAVWSNLRSETAELKGRVIALEKENSRIAVEHARSEERDKVFEKGIERLTKAIDDFDTRIGNQIERLSRVVEGGIDFDTRIGNQIERLSRVVEGGIRRHTPPTGTQKTTYKFLPNDDEEK